MSYPIPMVEPLRPIPMLGPLRPIRPLLAPATMMATLGRCLFPILSTFRPPAMTETRVPTLVGVLPVRGFVPGRL